MNRLTYADSLTRAAKVSRGQGSTGQRPPSPRVVVGQRYGAARPVPCAMCRVPCAWRCLVPCAVCVAVPCAVCCVPCVWRRCVPCAVCRVLWWPRTHCSAVGVVFGRRHRCVWLRLGRWMPGRAGSDPSQHSGGQQGTQAAPSRRTPSTERGPLAVQVNAGGRSHMFMRLGSGVQECFTWYKSPWVYTAAGKIK